MADKNAGGETTLDPSEFARNLSEVAQQSQRLVQEFLARQGNADATTPDPLNIGTAFMEMTTRLMQDPARLVEAQAELWKDYLNLWHNTARRMMGEEAEAVIEPDRSDRRFRHEAWSENQVFDFIKQSYLLTSRWLLKTVKEVDGLDPKDAQKVDFYTRQFVDAMAPSNFLLTNPEVLQETLESRGENLVRGLNNLLKDLERGQGSAAHQHDRRHGVRAGPQHRDDARQGDLPEPADAASAI